MNLDGSTCLLCKTVRSKTDRNLRRHIERDILPYTCILDNCLCLERVYGDEYSWEVHMTADHEAVPYWVCLAVGSSEQCPAFEDKNDFISHLQQQHSKIKTEQIPILLSAWLRTSPVLLRSCPLCPFRRDNAKAMLSHTARPIYSFSLRSLPSELRAEDRREEFVYGDPPPYNPS